MVKRKKAARSPAARKSTPRAARPRSASSNEALPPVAAGAVGGFSLSNDEIERALLTGEDAGVLEDYFGPRDYTELRELSQRAATRRARGGPKVLILPGITGSRLGTRSDSGAENIIWFDPLDLAAGAISQLAMSSGVKIVPLGVILLFYLKLKLRLMAAGFDADHYSYDWRQSLDRLGTELAQRLRSDASLRGASLVCHSMGGLVARAAAAALGSADKDKLGKVVMLGTPNFGSFAAVQTLQGNGDTVKKLAFLDLRHSAQEIATEILGPMPGACQLLPSPERFNAIDLFDPKRWPKRWPQPAPSVLRQVPGVLAKLAPADERFYLIAGINRETVTGLTKDDQKDEFVFEMSMAGDGTVPLDFALLPGTKATYYVEEGHGSLPNNRVVAQAVGDILGTGSTSALSSQPPAIRRETTRLVSQSALAAQQPYPGRRHQRLSQRELREVLSEFVSAEARDGLEAAAGAPATTTAGAPAQFQQRFENLVVGRRRQHRLDLRIALGDAADVDTSALVIGTFRGVAPAGAARALDQRMNGAITELTQRRMVSGNVGEVFLLPTAQRTVRADMVAFAGLGAFDTFTDEVLRIAAENVIRTLILGGVKDVATVLIGGGSGTGVRSALENLLAGLVKGLRDADANRDFRRITLCEMSPERYEQIKQELFRLSSTSLFDELEVTFDELRLPPALAAVPAGRLAAAGPDPIYLLVRQESATSRELTLRTSVLGAGGKATVVSGVKVTNKAGLDAKLSDLESSTAFNFQRAPAYGRDLTAMLVSDEALSVLAALKDRHLVVVHDAESSRIPWETAAIPVDRGDWLFAKEAGLSRRYVADHLSVAKWLEERREDAMLSMLLVVNPTLDLDGAEEEGKRILEILSGEPGVHIDVIRGEDATRAALENAFRAGTYDAIHYAGHAFFDPQDPGNSGLLCSGKVVLSGRDLAGLGNLPALVFFNACEAGRVRKAARGPTKAGPSIHERIDQNVGLAEAFLRGGVANYVGTYWPVGDEPAKVFAERFYKGLMKGESIGAALVAGRKAVWEKSSVDWADYIHYGSHNFVLKVH